MSRIRRYLADDRGATAIEYCMIGGLISIAILIGCMAIGVNLQTMFYGPLSNALK